MPARHGQDGVADHLAGAVVGDVAAPVDPEQLRTHTGRVDQHVLGPCADARRVDVRVLEQQEPVVSRLARRPKSTLKGVSVPVGNPCAEPAQAQRAAGRKQLARAQRRAAWRTKARGLAQISVAQSRVWRMSRTLAMKAAA